MKTSYIYLNEYPHGYLYVGSHTWDGPEGVLDPNYHGSSSIANRYKWSPVSEKILEVCDPKETLHRECYWINRYLITYGVSDISMGNTKSIAYMSKFKRGVMLNMHANDASVINTVDPVTGRTLATTDEALEKRRNNPAWRKHWKESMRCGGARRFSDAGNSSEARAKAMITRNKFWRTPEGKKERSETCRRSAETRAKSKDQWKCDKSATVAPLSTLCVSLGYKRGCGPYDWWRKHGSPDVFTKDNITFVKL